MHSAFLFLVFIIANVRGLPQFALSLLARRSSHGHMSKLTGQTATEEEDEGWNNVREVDTSRSGIHTLHEVNLREPLLGSTNDYIGADLVSMSELDSMMKARDRRGATMNENIGSGSGSTSSSQEIDSEAAKQRVNEEAANAANNAADSLGALAGPMKAMQDIATNSIAKASAMIDASSPVSWLALHILVGDRVKLLLISFQKERPT